jgi:Zn-finger nucleic acid-binding protein
MALIVQASGETDRLCPVDQVKMTKEIAHMIVVDRCPTCSGVWLDGGELERLKGDVNEQAILAMSRGFGFP